jgi:hypothetical protein
MWSVLNEPLHMISIIYLGCLRNSVNTEFRMFFQLRVFPIPYGIRINSAELCVIPCHGNCMNSAEFRMICSAESMFENSAVFRGIPQNVSHFRIKFRLPRNSKKSFP